MNRIIKISLYSLSGIILSLIAGGYWLLIWLFLSVFFGFENYFLKLKNDSKSYRTFLSYSGIATMVLIIIRTFMLDFYQVPSKSMLPALSPGEKILVSKTAYGIQLPKNLADISMINIFHKLLFKRSLIEVPNIHQYRKIHPLSTDIAKEDLILFNHPKTSAVHVKRCIGLAGDTVQIVDEKLYINNQLTIEPYLEEANNKPQKISVLSTPEQSIKNLSPLIIPQKGQSIALNMQNIESYRKLIQQFEEKEVFYRDGIIFIDGQHTTEFTFSYDYYFVMGDNRKHSLDSRHWGLLPYPLIIGKVIAKIPFEISICS